MTNFEVTLSFNQDQLEQIDQLLSTRKGVTAEQLLKDVMKRALNNECYRQERNRRVNQERKEEQAELDRLRAMLLQK